MMMVRIMIVNKLVVHNTFQCILMFRDIIDERGFRSLRWLDLASNGITAPPSDVASVVALVVGGGGGGKSASFTGCMGAMWVEKQVPICAQLCSRLPQSMLPCSLQYLVTRTTKKYVEKLNMKYNFRIFAKGGCNF